MCGRYIYILVLNGLLLCAGFTGGAVAQGQTQPEESSSQDTVSRAGEIEVPATVTRERIEYSSEGRKDPFRPLFETEKEQEEELPLLRVDGATVAGIMVGPAGRLGLIRDSDGRTYVLGEGAKVKNGYLRQIKKDRVIFHVAKYGRYRRVEMELKSATRAQEFERGVARNARGVKSVQKQPKVNKLKVTQPQVPQPKVEPVKVHVPPEQMKGSKFTLQVAAFKKESDAERLHQWLKERGFGTRIESVTIPESGLWYRVRFGMYDTYNDVKEMAETFRERFDFYCWIVPLDS